MSLIQRYWCLHHGLLAFYWLRKGLGIKLCGFVYADGDRCTFPVRKEAPLDRMQHYMGEAAMDAYLIRHIGGPAQ